MSNTSSAVEQSTVSAMSSSTLSSTTSDTIGSTSAGALSSATQSVNITSLVNIRLDMFSTAYRRWHRLFNVVLGRFNLCHHVDGTNPRPNDPVWIQEDLTVLMWLHATLADDLLDMVMDDDDTARRVWTKISDFFLGNKASRAVQLEQELHNLEQGDLSATAYCHRLKTLADALADCDRPVEDRALVYQLIRSLNPKFHVLRQMLPALPTFPTFMAACDQLIVAENTLAMSKQQQQSQPDTALAATDNATDNANTATSNSQPRTDGNCGHSSSSPEGKDTVVAAGVMDVAVAGVTPMAGDSNRTQLHWCSSWLPGSPPALHGAHLGLVPPGQASLGAGLHRHRPTTPATCHQPPRWHLRHPHPSTLPAFSKLCKLRHCLNGPPQRTGSWTLAQAVT
ncbi:hypothetical protein U9M48_027179 [Paspalum notatum var. saurae]|uniref:Retrotransposon gag domain-containing protein n=1 Tax=Paspalum notatum var. saurae TaxID=547442 RepID=A0AAQ3TSE3_PASNO